MIGPEKVRDSSFIGTQTVVGYTVNGIGSSRSEDPKGMGYLAEPILPIQQVIVSRIRQTADQPVTSFRYTSRRQNQMRASS